jgi:hypothetical protein
VEAASHKGVALWKVVCGQSAKAAGANDEDSRVFVHYVSWIAYVTWFNCSNFEGSAAIFIWDISLRPVFFQRIW